MLGDNGRPIPEDGMMRIKNNREFKIFTEERGFQTAFFFYTDDGQSPRRMSPMYFTKKEDEEKGIEAAWEEFMKIKNDAFPEYEPKIDEEHNRQLEELENLPKEL